MEILVLGYGNVGSIVAKDLAESMPSANVAIAGRHELKAKEVAATINRKNVTTIRLDADAYDGIVDAMKRFDLIVGTLPGDLGYRSIQAAIDAKVDMVDVSYMPQNPLTLDERAIKAGVTVVPDCGVAPGLSNLLVGHALAKLGQVESIHIMVGGLPKEPVPPLGYVLTWSPTDLIDEYTRKANIIQKGRVVEVEPLTGLEEIEFLGVGKLEGFYTDGLRTLLHTIKDVENMWEKTLRYPGHAHSIQLLKTLGFFSKDPIQVDKTRLTPRDVTVEVLKNKLLRPEMQDLLAMKVEVSGTAKRERKRYVYHLLDRYDQKNAITAMARTTAYPASIVSQLVAKNMVTKKGLVPLENLGVRDDIFSTIMTELEKREVKIRESVQ